ncbi:RNA polymerase sigma factor [Foetidibacter luteolus]|uniref:RNA polymerase sigma factor n=1 Tax=Foetidibacter luteolus TaxID=2608880 RepID=UPI00129B9D03|nr:sigma-70 family RNA polymerase sigma factor [Foetidibacter luteolus]
MEIATTYTEAELPALLKARDWSAFSFLYENYSGALYSTILHIIPEREKANQVLLETFVYIMLNIQHYSIEKGSLFTWMFSIARKLSLRVIKAEVDGLEQHVLDGDSNGYGLYKALQQLTPESRHIFELVYYKGYSYQEVADRHKQTAQAVKQQLSKALIQLRDILK